MTEGKLPEGKNHSEYLGVDGKGEKCKVVPLLN
jgi:hypothetical protein